MHKLSVYLIILFNTLVCFGNPQQGKKLIEDEWYSKIDKVIREIYDPLKEAAFDKNMIKQDINNLLNSKKPDTSKLYNYIEENYYKKNRVKAALFALEEAQKYFNKERDHFDISKSICYCKYYIFGSKVGDDCINKAYLAYGPFSHVKLDQETAEERKKIEQEIWINILLFMDEESNELNGLKKIVNLLIIRFLENNNDIRESWKTKFNSIYEANNEFFKEQINTELLEAKRKSATHEFISNLEKLLVLRDEKKLSNFLKKYALTDEDYQLLYNNFRDKYFKRNFAKITFDYDEPSTYTGSHFIGGPEGIDKYIQIEADVITDPPTSGKECPEVLIVSVMSKQSTRYCFYKFNFYFKAEKLFISKY